MGNTQNEKNESKKKIYKIKRGWLKMKKTNFLMGFRFEAIHIHVYRHSHTCYASYVFVCVCEEQKQQTLQGEIIIFMTNAKVCTYKLMSYLCVKKYPYQLKRPDKGIFERLAYHAEPISIKFMTILLPFQQI